MSVIPSGIVKKFLRADELILDTQEHLCKTGMTHVADELDLLRRKIRAVFSKEARRRERLLKARRQL